jgi:hypothetical protein
MSDELSPRDELAATLIGLLAAGMGDRPVAMADELMRLGWRKPQATATPGLGTFHRQPRELTYGRIGAIESAAKEVVTQVRDLQDMVAGRGAHEGHTQTQAGRCVVCSCGARAQGRLPR